MARDRVGEPRPGWDGGVRADTDGTADLKVEAATPTDVLPLALRRKFAVWAAVGG